MNEELQRELINILRAMKDGSPEAFKVLVDQRSLYCWGQAILGIFMLLASVILFRFSRWSAAKCAKAVEGDEAGVFAFTAFLLAIGCIFTCAYGVRYIFSIPEALAPLGRVFEVLR